MYMNEKVLNYALESMVQVEQEDGDIVLKKQDLGFVDFPTGKIVANDPCVLYQLDEYTVSVEPNSYPVSISIAHMENQERIALAMIKFSEKKPVRWEMALVQEQKTDILDGDKYFGYGVNAGTGGFMDKSIADKLFKQRLTAYDVLKGQFDKNIDKISFYVIGNVTGGDKNEVVVFTSGYGDGMYPSYFGYDEGGKPCVLVTDFLVIE